MTAAGWRIEPPVSVPVAARHRSAATAAAEPPDEPPGTRLALELLRPPGIEHRTEGAGLVGRAHGEFVHVGLAQHHRAGVPQILGHGGFIRRHEIAQDLAAGRGAHALGAEQILDRQRQAFQRAAPRLWPRCARRTASAIASAFSGVSVMKALSGRAFSIADDESRRSVPSRKSSWPAGVARLGQGHGGQIR